MARQKNTKPASSSKAKPENNAPTGLDIWRSFYATESVKLLKEKPNLKHSVLRKRVSAAYKKHKEELAREANGETGSGEE
ncbi:hypothetical protein JCM8208_007479 [Rhodotorula glutinis]